MIIVAGATGFIGNLVADLNAAGRSDIVPVDDRGTEYKWKSVANAGSFDVPLGASRPCKYKTNG
jgi:ADP-L-glycero-D-manno-heptose 6-epimerase